MNEEQKKLFENLLMMVKGFEDEGETGKANALKALINSAFSMKKDNVAINIDFNVKLEKFNGEKIENDNKKPVETIEFTETI